MCDSLKIGKFSGRWESSGSLHPKVEDSLTLAWVNRWHASPRSHIAIGAWASCVMSFGAEIGGPTGSEPCGVGPRFHLDAADAAEPCLGAQSCS